MEALRIAILRIRDRCWLWLLNRFIERLIEFFIIPPQASTISHKISLFKMLLFFFQILYYEAQKWVYTISNSSLNAYLCDLCIKHFLRIHSYSDTLRICTCNSYIQLVHYILFSVIILISSYFSLRTTASNPTDAMVTYQQQHRG